MRCIAVDWSGAVKGAAEKIWLAEADDEGGLCRLENGRGRDAVTGQLLHYLTLSDRVVVGLDFAFSAPAWFLRQQGLQSAPDLWSAATRDGEEWLRRCEPPFWGKPGTRRPALPQHLRRTETEVPVVAGVRPKSVFQVYGAGAVGTGSWRGMPFLKRLRDAGFAIWPFDERPTEKIVIEIYPRVLTGPVVKSEHSARQRYLAERYPLLDPATLEEAASSEDAFDAAVSAMVMAAARQDLCLPSPARDEIDLLEGRIWYPRAT